MSSVNDPNEMSGTGDVLALAQEIVDTFSTYGPDEANKNVCEVIVFETVFVYISNVDISNLSTFIGSEVQSCFNSYSQGECQHLSFKSEMC